MVFCVASKCCLYGARPGFLCFKSVSVFRTFLVATVQEFAICSCRHWLALDLLVLRCPCMASRATTLRDAVEVLGSVGYNRIIDLSDFNKRFAVLVFGLSAKVELAVHWSRLQLQQAARWKPGVASEVTNATVSQWCAEFAEDPLILACLATPNCSLRGQVHLFLTESLVSERVQKLSDTGLLVPSSYIVALYLRLIGFLPSSAEVDAMRARLSTNKNYCKKWLKRFRERWNVQWGSTSIPHGVGETRQRCRARIFFQWLLFELSAVPDGADVVIINMDETALTAVKVDKLGNSSVSRDAAGRSGVVLRKMRPLKRTSLIASVCNSPDIQRSLPQIRVVSYRKDEGLPTQPVRQAYADADLPQLAYHGTTGWVSTAILKNWLQQTVNAVRSRKPNCAIILVVDDAPSHIADAFIEACRARCVRLVILPAKMTWCLQPLDTHVFSRLKRRIRELLFEYQERLMSSSVPPLERIRQHGRAIKEILVDQDWTRTLQRSGFTGDMAAVRPQLRKLLEPDLPTPRLPLAADIMEVLQVPLERATKILTMLAAIPLRPAAPAVVVAPAVAADPGPSRLPVISLSLSRSARLPPARPRRGTGVNVWFSPPEPRGAVTRSMSRELAEASLPSIPLGLAAPAPKRARRAPSRLG